MRHRWVRNRGIGKAAAEQCDIAHVTITSYLVRHDIMHQLPPVIW